jgi:hypothetical protein
MKPGCLFIRASALLFPAAVLCGRLALGAAAPASGSHAVSAAGTNAAPAEAAIPQSVFVQPATKEEGKDPFFPRSLRPYGPGPVKASTNNPAPQMVVELKYNGMSGTADHRLAIINGRTFEQGEEGEVRSGQGRVSIRVVEIKPDYVVVIAAGQQQVLRRSGL